MAILWLFAFLRGLRGAGIACHGNAWDGAPALERQAVKERAKTGFALPATAEPNRRGAEQELTAPRETKCASHGAKCILQHLAPAVGHQHLISLRKRPM